MAAPSRSASDRSASDEDDRALMATKRQLASANKVMTARDAQRYRGR